MDEVVFFEKSHVEVKYIRRYKLVQIVWKGEITNDQYQEAFLKALEFQKRSEFDIDNFLSDTRNQGPVNPENRKWFEDVALPSAIKQGLKRGGSVFDGSIFKKFYLNIILQATSKFKLPFKLFRTLEEAYKWFDSFND